MELQEVERAMELQEVEQHTLAEEFSLPGKVDGLELARGCSF